MNAILALFSCLLLAFSSVLLAETPRRIAVSGYSYISVAPDQAKVHMVVRQISKESADSRRLVLQSLASIAKKLNATGIDDKKIRQSHISQGKHSQWQNGTNVDLGFYSQLTLNVEVDNLDKLSAVYDALSAFAEVQINHTEFKHSKREEIEQEQRHKAIANARERASSMLSVLDERLGRVLLISEHHSISGPPMPMQRAVFAEAAPEPPSIDFGDIRISARVNVEFEIE